MNCIGAILAGGGAARLGGAAKGLELVGGERIIDRVALALRAAADEIVVVSSASEAAAWLPGARVVADRRPQRASVVGLHAALGAARDAALVVAWDMPFVSAALLRHMRELGERSGAAVIPTGPDGREPLCAYYPAGAVAVAERQLGRGELRLSALVAALPHVVEIAPTALAAFGEPGRLFFNVNDAADLARARAIAEGDAS